MDALAAHPLGRHHPHLRLHCWCAACRWRDTVPFADPEECSSWERELAMHGDARRKAYDAGSTLTCLPVRAGLLGIGGGMIVNPLLLEFGTHPHVAAATSTLMVRPRPLKRRF